MKRAGWLLLTVVGCAAPRKEAMPSAAPPPTSTPERDGVDEKAATPVDTEQPATATPGTAPAPKPPSAAPVTPGTGASGTVVSPGELGKAQRSFDDASTAFAAAGNDCAQLCKALHSMTHATERLCDLTQGGTLSDQQRCTDARARLDVASAKVKSSCGAC